MDCPTCGSNDTRRFSAVYERGTSKGRSESSSGDEIAHFSQTPLAKKCSPPKEPTVGGFMSLAGWILSFFVALKVGGYFHGFWYGVAGFFGAMFMLYRLWLLVVGNRHLTFFKEAMARWEKSWVCLKCGGTSESEMRV
jgi:hypothetical protein